MKKKSSNLNNVTTSIEDKIKELIGKAETLTKNLMNPHHALENASNTKPKSKLFKIYIEKQFYLMILGKISNHQKEEVISWKNRLRKKK